MKCFYHTDMDGKCSAAIVYKFYKRDRDYTEEKGEECAFIPITYKDTFPFGDVGKDETIIIVDFSLQKSGEMDRLLSITDKVIWLDHHITAIDKHAHLDTCIRGLRRDGTAGCELTWEYFYPKLRMPNIVKYLGDYDVWAFKYGDITRHVQVGVRLEDTSPESDNWAKWLDNKGIGDIIEGGIIGMAYRDNYYKGLVKTWSFPSYFEGYKAACCNASSVSSALFDTIEYDFDIMIPFCFDGIQWTVALYTKRDDIDCSQLAKKYGGGGHRQAAGFQCKELPFKKEEFV